MKFASLKLILFLSLAFLLFSCGSDDTEDEGPAQFDCGGTTCGSASENIIGSWDVTSLGEDAGTVTFNADGTGSSSEDGEFSRSNAGFDYNTFTWAPDSSDDFDFTVDYDFDQTNGPLFGITFSYKADLNQCNCIELVSGFFENESSLRRR